MRQAQKGGVSTLASTPAIHNAILAKRPDLLDALFTDYWRSRFGEEGTGKDGASTSRATAYPLPIFGVRDGKFTSHYSLTFIEAAQLAPDVPKLSAAQKEAIDVLMATAQELCFEMTLEPGDLQLINSHVTYHGRTPFEDDASSGHDRLLLRLWLTMANNRPLPARVTRSCGAASRPASRAAGSSRSRSSRQSAIAACTIERNWLRRKRVSSALACTM